MKFQDRISPHIESPGFYGPEYNGFKARDYPEAFIKQLIDSVSSRTETS